MIMAKVIQSYVPQTFQKEVISATNHDVGEALGIGSAVMLTEPLPSLRVVGVVSGLRKKEAIAQNKRVVTLSDFR
jgi:hypothetical protein